VQRTNRTGMDSEVAQRHQGPSNPQTHSNTHQESTPAPRGAHLVGERAAGTAADRENRVQRLSLRPEGARLHQPALRLRSETINRRPHSPPLQQARGPPEPHLREPVRTRQHPDHPKHATASHQSHPIYRADADPWAKWGSQARRRQQSAGGRLKVLQTQNTRQPCLDEPRSTVFNW
jgi:hypothetical protein